MYLRVTPSEKDVEPATSLATAKPQLNDEQLRAVCFLADGCLKSRTLRLSSIYGFQGGAGTGKTFTVAHESGLLSRLLQAGLRVGIAASTHIACDVLRGFLLEQGIHQEVRTLASVLGLREVRRGGDVTYEPKGESKLWEAQVWLVDESSMIPPSVFDTLRAQQRSGQTVIFMGDASQLCPVEKGGDGFKLSPAIDLPEERVVTLHQVQRYGGVLLEKATLQRTDPEYWKQRWIAASDDKAIIKTVNRFDGVLQRTFREEIIETQAELGASVASQMRMLCYRNEQVDYWNGIAFRALYGSDADPYQQGMTLITRDGIKDGFGDDDESHLLWGRSAQVFIAEQPYPDLIRFPWEPQEFPLWEFWTIKAFSTRTERWESFDVLIPSQFKRWKSEVSRLWKIANDFKQQGHWQHARQAWSNYWTLKDRFADVQYGWASTVHRAQGCGFDTVFLDLNDLARAAKVHPKLAQSLMYTATTRARRRVVCVGD